MEVGESAFKAVDYAVKMRRYVREWLAWKLPHEYSADFEVGVKNG